MLKVVYTIWAITAVVFIAVVVVVVHFVSKFW